MSLLDESMSNFIAQLEAYGEPEVRRMMAKGEWGQEIGFLRTHVENWLRSKEAARVLEAVSIAHEAVSIARETNKLARSAESIAKDALRTAQQERTAAVIAAIAAIIAVVAVIIQ
jgi:hypothetical protein